MSDAASAPDAIRPGAFGAMLELRAGADVLRALADFRARLPEFAHVLRVLGVKPVLVFHLHHQYGVVLFIDLLQVSHERCERARIGITGFG